MAGKKELVEYVYKRVGGLTKRQAWNLVESVFHEIRECLERGNRVTIPRFGSFAVTERASRKGRNPATGTAIIIPASRNVRFRANKRLAWTRSPLRLDEGIEEADEGGANAVESASGDEYPAFPGPIVDAIGKDPTRASDRVAPATPDPDISYPGDLPPKSGYHVLQVVYATDRKPTGSGETGWFYSSARGDGTLRYGVCEVSIPEDHRMGRLEGPTWRRFEFRADPEKHVVVLGLTPLSEERFFGDLSATLQESPKNQILLFLHGFNVSFEDAARRTAQMAYDLQFEGAPAFFSWPSKGKLSITGYTHDENNAEWTIPHLKQFLEGLAARSGAEAIHLIAHSMGNRALTRALEQLAAVMADPAAPNFSEVILTAPDIDAEVFRQVAASFRGAARRVTLYASAKDRALRASHKFHGYPRAGDGGENIVVVPGIETIDASAVDTNLVGHFYYGDNRSVLSDVFQLLRDGRPPKERFGLQVRHSATGSYWVFVP
jgi:esterase/lipase superfamily enzyme/nucleoid DNA-binding protein